MAIRSALMKFLSSRSFRFPFPGQIQTKEAHSSAFLPKKLHLATDSAERFLAAPKDTFSHQHPALFCSFADNNSGQQTEGNVETNQGRKEIRSRTMRIRGIPYSATEADVRHFFGKYTPSVKDLNFTFTGGGKFLGEAFVEFSDANTCKEAFTMAGNKIRARFIEIFSLGESELDEMLRLRDVAPSTIIFIRRLPPGCTEDDIRSFFHGLEVVSVHSHGQTFVQFVDNQTLEKALRKDQEYIGDGRIQLFRSSQEELEWARALSMPTSARVVGGGRSVKMRGLPFSAQPMDVIQFFKPLDVVDVELLVHRGRPSGSAVVLFQSHEDAVEAMKKHRQNIGERYVELRLEDSVRDRD